MPQHATYSHPDDLRPVARWVRRVQYKLTITLNRATAIALVTVAIAVTLFPVPQLNSLRPLVVAAWAAIALVLIILVVRRPEPSASTASVRWPGFIAASSLALATAVAAATTGILMAFDYGWDAASVMEAALPLARGAELTAADLDYFSRHDNNLLLLLLDTSLVHFADAWAIPVSTAVALCNGACAGIMSASTYALASRYTRLSLALAAQALLLVFIGFSPWNAVPYTDLPLAALVSLSLALALRVGSAHVWLDWALMLVAAGILALAILLKPTAWIVVIAAAFAVLLDRFEIRRVSPGRVERPERAPAPSGSAVRRLIRGAVFLSATSVLALLILPQLIVAASGLPAAELNHDRRFPSIHFIRIGMETRLEQRADTPITVYGAWSEQAQKEMMQANSEADRIRISADAISARLTELGPGGYLDFLGKKAIMNWGDASFFSWQEGTDRAQSLARAGTSATEGMRVWNHPSGAAYAAKNEILTGVWIALLVLVGYALWARAARLPVLLSLCMLGIGMFTLGFEGRSRYLIVFVPVLMVLVACAVRALRTVRPDEVPAPVTARVAPGSSKGTPSEDTQ